MIEKRDLLNRLARLSLPKTDIDEVEADRLCIAWIHDLREARKIVPRALPYTRDELNRWFSVFSRYDAVLQYFVNELRTFHDRDLVRLWEDFLRYEKNPEIITDQYTGSGALSSTYEPASRAFGIIVQDGINFLRLDNDVRTQLLDDVIRNVFVRNQLMSYLPALKIRAEKVVDAYRSFLPFIHSEIRMADSAELPETPELVAASDAAFDEFHNIDEEWQNIDESEVKNLIRDIVATKSGRYKLEETIELLNNKFRTILDSYGSTVRQIHEMIKTFDSNANVSKRASLPDVPGELKKYAALKALTITAKDNLDVPKKDKSEAAVEAWNEIANSITSENPVKPANLEEIFNTIIQDTDVASKMQRYLAESATGSASYAPIAEDIYKQFYQYIVKKRNDLAKNEKVNKSMSGEGTGIANNQDFLLAKFDNDKAIGNLRSWGKNEIVELAQSLESSYSDKILKDIIKYADEGNADEMVKEFTDSYNIVRQKVAELNGTVYQISIAIADGNQEKAMAAYKKVIQSRHPGYIAAAKTMIVKAYGEEKADRYEDLNNAPKYNPDAIEPVSLDAIVKAIATKDPEAIKQEYQIVKDRIGPDKLNELHEYILMKMGMPSAKAKDQKGADFIKWLNQSPQLVEQYYPENQPLTDYQKQEIQMRKHLDKSEFLGFKNDIDADRIFEKVKKYVGDAAPRSIKSIFKILMAGYEGIIYRGKLQEGTYNSIIAEAKPVVELARSIEAHGSRGVKHEIYLNAEELANKIMLIKGLSSGESSSVPVTEYAYFVGQMIPRLGREWNESDVKWVMDLVRTMTKHFSGPEELNMLFDVYKEIQDELVFDSKNIQKSFAMAKNSSEKIIVEDVQGIRKRLESLILATYEQAKKVNLDLKEYIKIADIPEGPTEENVWSQPVIASFVVVDNILKNETELTKDFLRKRGNGGRKASEDMNMGLFIFANSAIAEPDQEESTMEEPVSMSELEASLDAIANFGYADQIMDVYVREINKFADVGTELNNNLETKIDTMMQKLKPVSKKLKELMDMLFNFAREAGSSNSIERKAVDVNKFEVEPMMTYPAKKLLDIRKEQRGRPVLDRAREYVALLEDVPNWFSPFVPVIVGIKVTLDSWLAQVQEPFLAKEVKQAVGEHYRAGQIIRGLFKKIEEKVITADANLKEKFEEYGIKAKPIETAINSDPDRIKLNEHLHTQGDLLRLLQVKIDAAAARADRTTVEGQAVVRAAKLIRERMADIAGIMEGKLVTTMDVRKHPMKEFKNLDELNEMMVTYDKQLDEAIVDKRTNPNMAIILKQIKMAVKTLVKIIPIVSKYMPQKATEVLTEANKIMSVFDTMVDTGQAPKAESLYTIINRVISIIPEAEIRKEMREFLQNQWSSGSKASMLDGIKAKLSRQAEEVDMNVVIDWLNDILSAITEIEAIATKWSADLDEDIRLMGQVYAAIDMAKQESPEEQESVDGEPILAGASLKKEASIVEALVPNTTYLGYDLSENKMDVEEFNGRRKIIINKDLRNLVTKRINEQVRGAYQSGEIVNIDMGDYVDSATVVSYLGNGTYRVSQCGRDIEIASDKMYKL